MVRDEPLSVMDGAISPISRVITLATHIIRPFIRIMGQLGTGKGPFCRDQLPDFFCGMLWKVERNLGTAHTFW